MPLVSLNPATEEEMARFDDLTDEEIEAALSKGQAAFLKWRLTPIKERAAYMLKVAEILKAKAPEYGKMISLEMGKPLRSAVAEVEKCAWVFEFYAEKAEEFLAPEIIETDAGESYVQHDPLGIVLAVMPWNYPFWQAMRAAAPALMGGNTMLLKHASNVPQCGMKIQELFDEAGLPEGVFQNLLIGSAKVEQIIRDPRVKAATLTGSEKAGGTVASQCGEEIKPTLLELGGSDPFIVLSDADIQMTCEIGVKARFQNGGQSCIAAKRFIILADRYDEFVEKYTQFMESQVIGDPMDENTNLGPLATKQILDEIVSQVDKSVEMGAELLMGGKRPGESVMGGKGFFYEATLLGNVKKGMPAYDQETFGPVAAIIKVESDEEAIQVANDTEFGLSASLWTNDLEKAKRMATQIDAGAVFINGMSKSDPRLPFGGIKKSGYGRELSHHGLLEFVNNKTIWIK